MMYFFVGIDFLGFKFQYNGYCFCINFKNKFYLWLK